MISLIEFLKLITNKVMVTKDSKNVFYQNGYIELIIMYITAELLDSD